MSSILTAPVTVGIILFFHFKKRLKYRKRHEQQLLPIYISPAYKTKSFDYPNSFRFSFSPSLPRQSEARSQATPVEPDAPPAYQPSFAPYDPSRYQGVDRVFPTMGINGNSPGLSALTPVHYPDDRLSSQPLAVDNRFSFQRSEGTEVIGRAATSNYATHTRQESRPLESTDRPRRPRPALSLITNL